MLLPSRVPPKLVPRVDFNPERFRIALNQRGLRVTWEQAAECPCARQGAQLNPSGNLIGHLTQAGLEAVTAEARPDCPQCHGNAYLHHSAQEILAVITSASATPQPFQPYGENARGMLSFTLMPEHLPSYQDRFTLLDSVLLYRETKVRTAAAVESLRYPIVERTLDLAQGLTQASVLYLHRANADGLPPADGSGALALGVDFVVTDGDIDWTLGDAAGTSPALGARYSVSYYAHPRYVIVDHPHCFRDTFVKTKAATPTFQDLPVNAMGRLDFLTGDGG